MNQKLFGAIVIAGAALAGCRSGILADPDLSPVHDLGVSVDLAARDAAAVVDFASVDAPFCCTDVGGTPDLSGCIPISCILI